MTAIFGYLDSIVRTFLRLAVFVLAGLLVLGLLFIGAVAALLTALWFVLTGRKPAMVSTFMRFRQASQSFRPEAGVWPRQGANSNPEGVDEADVVDVQAREVPSSERQVGPSLKDD